MKTIYFEKPGQENTQKCLKLVYESAKELNIKTIIVASTTGSTALQAVEIFDQESINLIVVTHQDGFKDIGNELPIETKEKILQKRANTVFHTGTHAFAGLERSFRLSQQTMLPVEMIAITVRRCFGEGTKVSMEMAIMAADSGLVNPDSEIICVAGTGRGSDTAWVIKPSYSNKLFDLKMRYPICKPINF